MKDSMIELLKYSYFGNEVIEYIEGLEKIINEMYDQSDIDGMQFIINNLEIELTRIKNKIVNYEKLMKALNDGKVLIKSNTNNDGIGIFECEADIWATIGDPIVILEEC